MLVAKSLQKSKYVVVYDTKTEHLSGKYGEKKYLKPKYVNRLVMFGFRNFSKFLIIKEISN